MGDAATGSTAPSNGAVLAPELLRRDAILEAARLAADRFLADGVSWRDELSDVTASIGRAAEVSRVFVSENFLDDHGLLHSRQIAEWNAGGIAPQQDDPQLQSYPYDAGGFGRWRDVLSRGETLSGQIRDFPDAERALFEPQGVVSIVAVPVFVGADWWGIVGFDECHRERSWSAAELAALRTAASTIGVALRLERMGQQRVRALETTLRDVVRIVVEAGSGVAAALHIVDPASGALSMLAGHGLPEGTRTGCGRPGPWASTRPPRRRCASSRSGWSATRRPSRSPTPRRRRSTGSCPTSSGTRCCPCRWTRWAVPSGRCTSTPCRTRSPRTRRWRSCPRWPTRPRSRWRTPACSARGGRVRRCASGSAPPTGPVGLLQRRRRATVA